MSGPLSRLLMAAVLAAGAAARGAGEAAASTRTRGWATTTGATRESVGAAAPARDTKTRESVLQV